MDICFEVGAWSVAMLLLVCHWHTFFSCENHCMLRDTERNHSLHTLSKRPLIFPGKISEYLIHIPHIQASDGAKWDVLFLGTIKHATSSLTIPSRRIEWVWANTWRSLSNHMVQKTNTLSVPRHIAFMEAARNSKPSKLVIILPSLCFQQRSHEIFFGCTQKRGAGSLLNLSPKKGVSCPLDTWVGCMWVTALRRSIIANVGPKCWLHPASFQSTNSCHHIWHKLHSGYLQMHMNHFRVCVRMFFMML